MNARDEILNNIRARKSRDAPPPAPYTRPPPGDLAKAFTERATAVTTEVRIVKSDAGVPLAVAELLRARNMPARIHIPAQCELGESAWHSSVNVDVDYSQPGPNDAALNIASFGVAETGTLVYAAAPEAPPSWHFRPGFEIAVLHASDLVADIETALAKLKSEGRLPSTINFVTGPSRTADIEQTLELGAHGPKELAILLVSG